MVSKITVEQWKWREVFRSQRSIEVKTQLPMQVIWMEDKPSADEGERQDKGDSLTIYLTGLDGDAIY